MVDRGYDLESIQGLLLGEIDASTGRPEFGLRLAKGRLVIDGETRSLAGKRQILERAASIPGVAVVVDRLRVAPVRRVADAELRDELLKALVGEPAFSILAIREKARGRTALVRNPCKCSGVIEYEARDGVAILKGTVPGLGHKRLASVIAWRVAGTRDVVNGIAVTPAEEDSDDAVLDAVRLALDKDERLESLQLRVSVADRVVTLAGHVSRPDDRERAERNAWYVDGVLDVVNRISVRM